MRPRFVVLGLLAVTVGGFWALGSLLSSATTAPEPAPVLAWDTVKPSLTVTVMPDRWLALDRAENPGEPLLERPLSPGLHEVVAVEEGLVSLAQLQHWHRSADEVFELARQHTRQRLEQSLLVLDGGVYFFDSPALMAFPERLKELPFKGPVIVGAGAAIDSASPEAVAWLMQSLHFEVLYIDDSTLKPRPVALDGAWQLDGGTWTKLPLPSELQQAIDDAAYAREGALLKDRDGGDVDIVERDYSGEKSQLALSDEGGALMPPADLVAFQRHGTVLARASWDDVAKKLPGVLTREPNTVLEWYRLARFPTPAECAALGIAAP